MKQKGDKEFSFYKFDLKNIFFSYNINLNINITSIEFCPICKDNLSEYSSKIEFFTFSSECGHSVCSRCYKNWHFPYRCMVCNSISGVGYKKDENIFILLQNMISFNTDLFNIFTFQCENCRQFFFPNYISNHYFNKIYFKTSTSHIIQSLICGFCGQSRKTFVRESIHIYRARFLELLFENFYLKNNFNSNLPLFKPVNDPEYCYLFRVLSLTIFDSHIKTVQLERGSLREIKKLSHILSMKNFERLVEFDLSPIYLVFPSYINNYTIDEFKYVKYLLLFKFEVSMLENILFIHAHKDTEFCFVRTFSKKKKHSIPSNEIIDFFTPINRNYEIF